MKWHEGCCYKEDRCAFQHKNIDFTRVAEPLSWRWDAGDRPLPRGICARPGLTYRIRFVIHVGGVN
eukprot:10654388-Alexandrium_andersonii.AAC.1